MVVIDASVWVAVDSGDGSARDVCGAFLSRVLEHGAPIHQPTLTLVEVTAAVARRTHDESMAREAGLTLLAVLPPPLTDLRSDHHTSTR